MSVPRLWPVFVGVWMLGSSLAPNGGAAPPAQRAAPETAPERYRYSPPLDSPMSTEAGPETVQAHEKHLRLLQEAEDAIKPLPVVPIPTDPPPHEGALFNIPYLVAPPDLLQVEVLEALPGRPISGEHLVRPDGTITLGFYGDILVQGLTPQQVKEKIILRMRRFVTDEALGLWSTSDLEEPPAVGEPPEPPVKMLPLPRGERLPFDKDGPSSAADGKPPGVPASRVPVRRTAQALPTQPPPPPAVEEPPPSPRTPSNSIAVPIAPGGKVTITITIETGQAPGPAAPASSPAMTEFGLPDEVGNTALIPLPPGQSDRVFVDVASYNSKSYFVQGDVANPGKLPWTGNETVLDALQYAAGFLPTADPKNVRLVRPARGGKPAKVYKIDYEAIVEQGDARANLQIFPGDRLVIGRNKYVQMSVATDRLAAPYQTVVNSVLQYSFMRRSLDVATPHLTPAEREAALSEWFDAWSKVVAHPESVELDEKAFREALRRPFQAPKEKAPRPGKKKKAK